MLIGYAFGMLGILGLSWILAWFADLFPHQYVGFLGVVPVFLGIKRLYQNLVGSESEADFVPPASKRSQVITVALADVAHGPDTVILFSALLADKGVYAFAFGQKGLMAGLGLQGSKITPVRPD